jgi:hypothetical protein
MARVLLDTDAIIDYLAGTHRSAAMIRGLHDAGDTLCTCAVVVAELFSGLRPADRSRAQRLVDALVFLRISSNASKQAGEWRYSYARKGRTLSTSDVLIAATAVEHQAMILTGNATHFPMREVTVLSLPRP